MLTGFDILLLVLVLVLACDAVLIGMVGMVVTALVMFSCLHCQAPRSPLVWNSLPDYTRVESISVQTTSEDAFVHVILMRTVQCIGGF